MNYKYLNTYIIRWFRSKGLKINTYTINDKLTFQLIKKYQIDGVFTDNIEYLK